MAKSRTQKQEIVERLKQAFSESPSVTFVHFTRIPVSEETQIRRTMRDKNLSYYVAKKTLMRIAWEEAKVDGQAPELEGEVAIVYGGDDKTASAREINEFVKQYKDRLSIVGGIFDGEFQDAQLMNEIANIPSLDVLRGMFVNVINSPIQKLAIALDQIAQSKQG